MRIRVVQLAYGDEEPLPDRVERVAALVEQQRGADLVVLPELWPQGGFAYERWAELAEPFDGPTHKKLAEAARVIGATVHMGSFVERDGDGRLFNTSLLLGGDGGVLVAYRKIHLFGFGEGEPVMMSAGADVAAHDRIGLATCYDLRFPELFRALVDRGAELVLMPAAWPRKRIAHWRLLAQARAVEDQCVVVACNTAGEHAGVPMGGHSLVVDPWGTVLAEAGDGEEVLDVEVDVEQVRAVRETFPVLCDRRLPLPSRHGGVESVAPGVTRAGSHTSRRPAP